MSEKLVNLIADLQEEEALATARQLIEGGNRPNGHSEALQRGDGDCR